MDSLLNSSSGGTFVMVSQNDLEAFARDVARKVIDEMKSGHRHDGPDDTPVGIDEICRQFHLVKNNVKSRKWRLANSFPTFQMSRGSRVQFIPREVSEWVQKNTRPAR